MLMASNGWVFPGALDYLWRREQRCAVSKPSVQKWFGLMIEEERAEIEAGWAEVEEQFVASQE